VLHVLGNTPVLGVSMGNIALLRLDQTGGPAPGNKSFKLSGYIAEARRLGITRLVSFGGAWSNHLHALAATGYHHRFDTVGLVRGELRGALSDDNPSNHLSEETAMLIDARRWGMQLVHVSRHEYRQRNNPDYQREIVARFAPCMLIPEGGASVLGAQGCSAVATMLRQSGYPSQRIVLPVGTGTTLAGLAANLDARYELIGVSALKGAADLPGRVQALIDELTIGQSTSLSTALKTGSHARWRILHDHHCGGFARVSPSLREFMLAFEAAQGVQLEPVYTGKMLFALHQLYQRGELDPGVPVVALHTGGLQGRRGYDWLG
jgi:1-aminocyclopropane-1-carboxylate deaminase